MKDKIDKRISQIRTVHSKTVKIYKELLYDYSGKEGEKTKYAKIKITPLLLATLRKRLSQLQTNSFGRIMDYYNKMLELEVERLKKPPSQNGVA